MALSMESDVYYDPYDVDIWADPYPVFRRLREEAPLYYNDRYDFYALSRFADVEQGLVDNATFISGRGGLVEAIKADIEIPKGVFIWEDPPLHTVHRGLLSRVFTPKRMNALEGQVRDLCAQLLDPRRGIDRFDFVSDLGAIVPMRVIGMLLGIPEQDQETIRQRGDRSTSRLPGQPGNYESSDRFMDETHFGDYIAWRADHPSDDLMTALLNVEFDDEEGVVQKLTREEIIIMVGILATAGNETTNRLIGWSGKILAEHPDQRRELKQDPTLIPNAIEEILRFESPSVQLCRVNTRGVEWYGETVPAGSICMFINASANRDHRAFPPDGDVFDIHRKIGHHTSFGFGAHFCLGAALARMEGRVVLEEFLKRFTDWEIDYDNAELVSSIVRGWTALPAFMH
jgi:cytochrome P450